MALAETTTNTGATAGNVPAPAPEPFSYDEDRHFFEPSKLQDAANFLAEIAGQKDEKGNPVYTIVQYDSDWPEGAGLAVLPLARNQTFHKGTKEETTRRVCYAVQAWPYWGIDSVMSHPKGREYIASIIEADQAARILNPMRKQAWEEGKFDPSACPKTLSDHIEGMAADGGAVKAYTEVAKLMLPSLKGLAPIFRNFTPALLRQYLSNAPLARSFSAQLEDAGLFKTIINEMKAEATRRKLNTEIFDQWLETRDNQAEVDLSTLDISKLSFGADAK